MPRERDICIGKMSAPWEIAWDQSFLISLPVCGHDFQADELPASSQACLTLCPAESYSCATPEPALTLEMSPQSSHWVPRPGSAGCTTSPGGMERWELCADGPRSLHPLQRSRHAE